MWVVWVDVRRQTSGELARKALLVVCVGGVGVLSGFLMLPEPEAHAAAVAQVSVGGEAIDLGGDPHEAALLVARRYLDRPLTLSVGKSLHKLSRAALGARVDLEHLEGLLSQAADARSPLRRVHAQALGTLPLTLPMPASLDESRTAALLLRVKESVDQSPVPARIDPREGRIIAAEDGSELDLFGTFERVDHALQSGETDVQAAMREVKPLLGAQAFQHIDMHAVLGDFETHYNRATTSADRTHNLKLAASRIDGHVLQPGETFDFNEVVGDRTTTNGFRPAPVIADGELTSGMGGGTCQIASTLHAAVFFAGLPILMRYPHSRPSFYIKLGLDATVVYGSQNFRFKNDRSYPVVLGLRVQDGSVYASVHGPARDHTVTFIRRIDTILPFEEHFTKDGSLPSGLRVLAQRGVPGFKITRERVIKDDKLGTTVNERTQDAYPPTAQLWRIGKGNEPGAGFVRPPNDAHPEYVADEYLEVTQNEASGSYEVKREPGRTGRYGWTEREGMVSR